MMKLLVVTSGIIFALIFGYAFVLPELTRTPCEIESLQVESSEVNLRDRSHVKITMGHRFGDKVKNFAPRLKAANSSTLYKKNKNSPWMAISAISFRSNKTAKSAYYFLKNKWEGKKGDHQFVLHGDTVYQYSNYKFNEQCFAKVMDMEKTKLVSSAPDTPLIEDDIPAPRAVAAKPARKVRSKKIANKKVAKKKLSKKRKVSLRKKKKGKNSFVAKKQ